MKLENGFLFIIHLQSNKGQLLEALCNFSDEKTPAILYRGHDILRR